MMWLAISRPAEEDMMPQSPFMSISLVAIRSNARASARDFDGCPSPDEDIAVKGRVPVQSRVSTSFSQGSSTPFSQESAQRSVKSLNTVQSMGRTVQSRIIEIQTKNRAESRVIETQPKLGGYGWNRGMERSGIAPAHIRPILLIYRAL